MATNESLVGGESLAAVLHRHLVARESRGFGDTHNAMRRLQAASGLGFWTQWNMRAGKLQGGQAARLVRALVEAWEAWLRREAEANLRLSEALRAARHDAAFTTDVERFEAAAVALLAELEGAKAPRRGGAPAAGRRRAAGAAPQPRPHPRPLPPRGRGAGRRR